MRIFHYNENIPRIKFKCDAYNRTNLKMVDRLAKKTITQVVGSYEEYFKEILKEIEDCKTDDKEIMKDLENVEKLTKEGLGICDEIKNKL
jgi:5'-deoxynucleotidase YfbR-like HD superfamily hydrolase